MRDQKQQSKATLLPRLRFPEFREAGEWEYKELRPFLREHSERVPTDTQLPIYSSTRTGLKPQKDYFDNRELSNDGEYGIVPNGFFVYRHMSDDGTFKFNINKTGKPIAVSKEYPVFTTENLHQEFLLHLLNDGVEFAKFALAQKKGGTRTRLYLKVLGGWKVFLPSYSEQQKIAVCLSSLDELITAETRQLDALTTHKKGLLQQLFPREGESVPRLRFPEFREAGEWEEKRLDELAKRGSGHTPSKSRPEYYHDGIKWVSLADSKKLDNGLIEQTEIEISEQGIANSSAVLHPAGSVLISRDAGVGKSAVMKSTMAVSQHFIVWTCDEKELHNWFLYYILQRMKPTFEQVASGSTVKTIGLQFFIDMRLVIPHMSEQQKIAACLSSLDELIAAQGQKIDALKTHKKGLLQQLFPALGEAGA